MWQRKNPKTIGIYLIPTSSIDVYSQDIDLYKLASYLNREMGAAHTECNLRFDVLVDHRIEQNTDRQGLYSVSGIALGQQHPFVNFTSRKHNTTSSAIFAEARRTYIVDIDALSQIKHTAISIVGTGNTNSAFFVAIGSEVLSEDKPGAEFWGERTEDAYSCLSDSMSVSAIDNDTMSDADRPFKNVAHISLARLYSKDVFRDQLNAEGVSRYSKRALVCRYIIGNLANFIAGRLFREDITRDHDSLCVAETSWRGGEAESYKARGLCEECKRKVQQIGLSAAYGPMFGTWESAIKCIDTLASISDKIEEDAPFNEKNRKVLEISIGGGLLAALIGLAVTYDYSRDNFHGYVIAHWPGIFVGAAFLIVVAYTYGQDLVKKKRLP